MLRKIECPNCHTTFTIDEAGYADIVRQVHGAEFDKALDERLKAAEREKQIEIELAVSRAKTEGQATTAEKENLITQLKAKLESTEVQKELAVTNAVSAVEKERDALATRVSHVKLQGELNAQSLKDKYEEKITDLNDHIERLKDLKAKLSTKMVGESLEQHCEIEFNKIRATSFPTAYFEKDNDANTGSKADYIFRDADENAVEIVSIAYEMKNELDTTATKKKNEDFFRELDKDRNEKNCEYAILVSLLESESDLYNSGIVDVSYRYPRMYVIRPQFFIPMITLLRNAALRSLEYKNELALVRSQHIDITNFESDLEDFKSGFQKNYGRASDRFEEAIKSIDNSMTQLQKTKDALLKTDNNLRLANNKLQDLTIKKLTKKNSTMAEKFSESDNLEVDGDEK